MHGLRSREDRPNHSLDQGAIPCLIHGCVDVDLSNGRRATDELLNLLSHDAKVERPPQVHVDGEAQLASCPGLMQRRSALQTTAAPAALKRDFAAQGSREVDMRRMPLPKAGGEASCKAARSRRTLSRLPKKVERAWET